MQPNDRVKYFVINQKNGFRQYSADVQLIRRMGTVPNFWEFQFLTGQHTGRIIKDFVYETDQEECEEIKLRPTFRVIQGGKQ